MAEKGMNRRLVGALAASLGAVLALTGPVVAFDAPPIHFAPGRTQATVEGGVVRGDRNVHRFSARAGQMLSLKVTSLENNAVITLYGPGTTYSKEDGALDFNGKAIAGGDTDITSWAGKLPRTGRYLIVVGGTRGNASYKLTVSITGR